MLFCGLCFSSYPGIPQLMMVASKSNHPFLPTVACCECFITEAGNKLKQCACVRACVQHTCTDAQRLAEDVRSPRTGITGGVGYLMWVLGTEPRSFVRAAMSHFSILTLKSPKSYDGTALVIKLILLGKSNPCI